MADTSNPDHSEDAGGEGGETRRDILTYTVGAFGAIGVASVAWPFIDSLNPAADTLAVSTVEIDLSPVEPGQAITVMWRGSPVFVRRRTEEEIAAAEDVALDDLPDPEADSDRVQRKEWLILVGVCTHLGCVPQGQRPTEVRGEFGGWFCSCHGSVYDTSGRIRRGPAPTNLPVPPYEFLDDNRILVG